MPTYRVCLPYVGARIVQADTPADAFLAYRLLMGICSTDREPVVEEVQPTEYADPVFERIALMGNGPRAARKRLASDPSSEGPEVPFPAPGVVATAADQRNPGGPGFSFTFEE